MPDKNNYFKNHKKIFLLIIFLVSTILVSLSFVSFNLVSATNCWQYASNATGQCTSANGCIWKVDEWGSWCEELNCWSFWAQSDCASANVPGKNCSWQSGGTSYYCSDLSCWTFSGTNESTCVNNTAGRSCNWNAQCYSSGSQSGTDCWIINDQSTCTNTTGCNWGNCMDKGCWDYSTNVTCNAAKDPWIGRNCTWDETNSHCKEDSCGDFSLYPNKTVCDAASHCKWSGSATTGWCETIGCWSFDGNQTGCTNANTTFGIDCVWSSGYCMEDNCWAYDSNQDNCNAKAGCAWTVWQSSGWCEEINCWTWDSWKGGSEADCNGNASLYGLGCNWVNDSTNTGTGWCEKDFSNLDCTNYTNERECYDSQYCWWQANDWNNSSAGGNCTIPDWTTVTDSGTILNEWNPGCFIFDNNATECGWVVGCDNSTANSCNINATHENANEINTNGMNCTMINNSILCNDIAALSTCCKWQNGICEINAFDASCFKDLAQTQGGETSCEDATTKSNCNALASGPWYWPCKWDNATSPARCTVKQDDIWGNNTKSYIAIENKKICKAIGGKWITENYCVANVSVPTGRCEYKFDDETNCNKACFACEYQSDGSAHNSSANAKTACLASNLGYCEFTEDSSAKNGFGICRAKSEFVSGVSEECSASNCAGCTFMGIGNSSLAGNGTRTAEQHCKDYPNSCKWVDDSNAETGGYCVNVIVETCIDACDRCYTQDTCTNDGRTNLANTSGSCKWQGSDDDGSCVANIAGDVEVCWNGEDEDDDGLIDCADPGCYSDSFCGMVEGNCFVWQNSSDCNSDTDCEWVIDEWGSWCDFRGSQCWKYDGDAQTCGGITNSTEILNISAARLSSNNINESYTFTLSNLGIGWVGSTVVIINASGISLAGNYTVNYATQAINFTNNTFMVSGGGSGNITNVSYQYNATTGQYCEWQAGTGSGGCEQDWSIAKECSGGTNESNCKSITASDGQSCTWTNDTWCDGKGSTSEWCQDHAGWCDHPNFVMKDCWQYSSNSSCSGTSGCNWKSDEWSQPHCEVNWSSNCMNYFDSSGCTNVTGCTWFSDTWGDRCGFTADKCWNAQSLSACSAVTGVNCTWKSNWNSCEPSCFGVPAENSCTALTGCVWKSESGWCEEQQSAQCFNDSNSNDQNRCEATSGCTWRGSGWCNPKDGFNTGGMAGGGGVGGGMGGECYKYDGNQTKCINKTVTGTACGWFSEFNPWCEVDWGADCWAYGSEEAGCNATNGCWWNSEGGQAWCTNLMEQCWMNTTLQNNASICNNNAYCNATSGGGCEPTCFSATTAETCGTGCKWLTGWCNPVGMMNMYNEMETGAPVPLGMDACGTESISQASVDICGFGMKDMKDTYGFGVNVFNFENASVCNKVKISSFVMDMVGGDMGGGMGGGMGAPQASEKTGSGNETIKYIVYIDADGSTTGSCSIESDSSSEGYEFKLRYASEWDSNNSKATETFTSYKCENSKWVASDIKTSAWKQKMCNELGGPMIAIEKGELSRFPTLYSSTADLRVYVVTIGNTGNVTVPTDSAGPGWMTPGAIDFEIGGAMEFGANAAKFEDILFYGYVKYEDCYNGVDDNNDGAVDCADWDCEFSSACTSTGVNVAGFNDTAMPTLKGMRVEEYPDAALLMFEASKPVNGTLQFYGNDSQCLTMNASIVDIGIRSSNIREHKMWQEIAIYNDGTTASNVSLDYSLQNDTNYYYKLKMCDTDNRCSVSKCSLFVTSNVNKCGFCKFVLKIKEPTGWTASYDVNQDSTYEHVQGAVCGSKAGMKINYTDARAINIKLAKDDGTIYFEFLNVSVSKTGLNDKVRTLTASGDSVIGTSTLVGFNAQVRDKIINNLHPEVCRIKIPYTGTCDTLYHCDDDGNNCVDRTSAAGGAPIHSTNCVWEVPYCEFSTYKEYTAPSGDETPSSSGPSGSAAVVTNVTAAEEEAEEEAEADVSPEEKEKEEAEKEKAPGEKKVGVIEKIGSTWLWILIGVVVVVVVVIVIVMTQKKK